MSIDVTSGISASRDIAKSQEQKPVVMANVIVAVGSALRSKTSSANDGKIRRLDTSPLQGLCIAPTVRECGASTLISWAWHHEYR